MDDRLSPSQSPAATALARAAVAKATGKPPAAPRRPPELEAPMDRLDQAFRELAEAKHRLDTEVARYAREERAALTAIRGAVQQLNVLLRVQPGEPYRLQGGAA